MSSRKCLSGYQKRKLQGKRSDEIPKCQKLSRPSKSLSTPTAETSQASDSAQMVGALSSHTRPTVDTFDTDDDHSGQHESTVEQDEEQNQETGSKFGGFREYSDLANWPITVDDRFIQNCLMQDISFFQNKNPDDVYTESSRVYRKQNRNFSNKYFERRLKNGQTVMRSWLVYSKSKGCIYCFACKLFSKCQTSLTTGGFFDWMNVLRTLENHEDSMEHKRAMLCWKTRTSNRSAVDQQLDEQMRKNTQYGFEVLKRVVAVIKFLSERGLAFRGPEEKWGSPNNGNFMGAIELIAEFDPFLQEHLTKCKNEEVNVTYLSQTVYEELIAIMGKCVQDEIVNQINNLDTKYYSIVVDSMPDLTHVDQLVIVVRYCCNGKPCERFLTFLPIEKYSSTTLFNKIQQVLGEHKLSVENIRGLSYDNASNVKGLEKGLQALFKNISAYADYVPRAAHSLNFVGEKAAATVPDVFDYFGILQELYIFCSGSPQRWGILNTQGNQDFFLKNLRVTRWSAQYEAVWTLKNGYAGILQTLKRIFEDSEENPECKRDAKNLYHKLVKLECAILTVVWEEVLERFNKTTKKLQTPGLDVFEGHLLLSSLLLFVKELRENSAAWIAHYESEAKGLCEDITSSYFDASKHILTKFSDGTSGRASLKGADAFRTDVLNQLYDCLVIQLCKRIDPYEQIAKRFEFLSELVNNSEIDEDSIKLTISHYKDDIDDKLVSECYQFKKYLQLRKSQNGEENTPSKMQCAEVLQLIWEQHLTEVFPNITIALKLYLTMPITSCEAEWNFSKLSFIKNNFQSTMTDECLNSLCTLSLENDIARKLPYDKTIDEYVARTNSVL